MLLKPSGNSITRPIGVCIRQGDGGRISGYESDSGVVVSDTLGFGELKNRPSCALDTR